VSLGYGSSPHISQDGYSWKASNGAQGLDGINVTFGQNKFVAIGNHQVSVSASGEEWSQPSYISDKKMHGLCYGAPGFVAVGENYSIYSSPDGANWTKHRQEDSAGKYLAVTYANNRYIAVGEGYRVAVSVDGVKWLVKPHNLPVSGFANAIAYGNNRFVVVGTDGAMVSSDGLTWEGPYTPSGWDKTKGTLLNVTYAANQFIAVGSTNSSLGQGVIYTSVDGENWIERHTNSKVPLVGVAVQN
jgi:hypothetical protein